MSDRTVGTSARTARMVRRRVRHLSARVRSGPLRPRRVHCGEQACLAGGQREPTKAACWLRKPGGLRMAGGKPQQKPPPDSREREMSCWCEITAARSHISQIFGASIGIGQATCPLLAHTPRHFHVSVILPCGIDGARRAPPGGMPGLRLLAVCIAGCRSQVGQVGSPGKMLDLLVKIGARSADARPNLTLEDNFTLPLPTSEREYGGLVVHVMQYETIMGVGASLIAHSMPQRVVCHFGRRLVAQDIELHVVVCRNPPMRWAIPIHDWCSSV